MAFRDLRGQAVRRSPDEPVLFEPDRDLQPFLDATRGAVLRVEPPGERREIPDAGGELQVQLEAVHVLKQLVGRAANGLAA